MSNNCIHIGLFDTEVYDKNGRLEAVTDLLKSKEFTKIHVDPQSIEESEDGEYLSFVPIELRLFYVYAMK